MCRISFTPRRSSSSSSSLIDFECTIQQNCKVKSILRDHLICWSCCLVPHKKSLRWYKKVERPGRVSPDSIGLGGNSEYLNDPIEITCKKQNSSWTHSYVCYFLNALFGCIFVCVFFVWVFLCKLKNCTFLNAPVPRLGLAGPWFFQRTCTWNGRDRRSLACLCLKRDVFIQLPEEQFNVALEKQPHFPPNPE